MYALLGFFATHYAQVGSNMAAAAKLAVPYGARAQEDPHKITLSADNSEASLAALLLLSWQTYDW
jgi:hypothetical protein